MKRHRTLLCLGVVSLLVAVLGTVLWHRAFHHYPPKEVMKDVRAGLAARHVQDPKVRIETFLEARYGSLAEPANREKAFLDFFNVDHIKGLNFIVSHTPAAQKQVNTEAMAQWIAHYRATMTAEERTAIQARLNTETGRAMLRQATAQYQSQDVYFRGAQKPVIAELMATLADLRKQ
jgi:hypothetical protein